MQKDRYELPQVSGEEIYKMERRLVGMLSRERLPYNHIPEVIGYGKEEVMAKLEAESDVERWNPDSQISPRQALDVREGVNEIITNYITGMGLSGKWVDSDSSYSNSFEISLGFITTYAERKLASDPRVKSHKQALTAIMKDLAYEYMMPLHRTSDFSPLKEDLISLFPDKLPRIIARNILEPLDILDSIITQYTIEQGSKWTWYKEDDTKDVEVVVGYQDYLTGKIHSLPASRTAAQARQRERIVMHECIHKFSVSTNRETDPQLWMGKSGIKRFLVDLE